MSLRILMPASLAAAALTCASGTAPTEGAPSILFIGNSLTYTNDLPEMVRRIAHADGRTVRVAMVAGPNLAVVDHTTGSTDAPDRIAGARWDFVVLQQGPTPAGICRDTLVIAAMRLAPVIRRAGARPVLWLPWARRGGAQTLDPAAESVTLAARAVGGAVVPIGIAWRHALARDATLPLYGGDGYHPAPAGSLLAALAIYDRLVGRDVRSIQPHALTAIIGAAVGAPGVRTLAEAAHEASASWPPDPATAVQADTVHVASGGGPC